MADNTETITFDNDVLSNGQGGTLVVSGQTVVDYTDGSYYMDAKFTFPDGGYTTQQIYAGPGGLKTDGAGNYTVAQGDTFSFSYNSMQPVASGTMLYTGATPNYSGGGALTSTPGGTVPQPPPICFASGTRIETIRGAIEVEDLQVGDVAVTASGVLRPIVWIGQKVVDCTAAAMPSALWPVRIRAGAFGSGYEGPCPERDLFLSPGHPVRVGEGEGAHLVPVMCLINGTTVARVPVDQVTYWHVELDAHDLLQAEGLAAESYLDWGDRCWFANGGEHALENPDFVVPGLAGRCLPVAMDGPVVEAERRRLDAVFATWLAGPCGWPSLDAPAC